MDLYTYWLMEKKAEARLKEYTPVRNKSYHFESSENYVTPKKIRDARRKALALSQGDASFSKQVNAIAKLERLRHDFAKRKIDYQKYKQNMNREVGSFFSDVGTHVFSPSDAHDSFYEILNNSISFK